MSAAVGLIVIFIIGVLLNGFFAGYETGFVSCNPLRVRHLAEEKKNWNARQLLHALEHPNYMLTGVLIGTNISLLLGTIALTRQFGDVWTPIIATPLVLVFGELLPKSMFRIHPTRLSLLLLPPMRFFLSIFAPLSAPTLWITRHLLRGIYGQEANSMPLLMRSPEDVRILVDESADKGAIDKEEKEMIHAVMDLQTSLAKEIMVPRIDIQALPDTATRTELITLFQESGRTRIPIYHETIDEITGIVNAFTVLRDTTPENEDISRLVREAMHVHDTMKLDDVLRAMRDAKQSMAIVTDEYGGTDGLITIEDILEEIFGDICDEYDEEENPIRKVGENAYIVDTRIPIEELSETLDIPIEDDEVETLGGWIMHTKKRIPKKGDVIEAPLFRITVLDATPTHVVRVRMEKPLSASSDRETVSHE